MVFLFSICKELTEMVCISKLDFCAFSDLNVLVLMAGQGWTSGQLIVRANGMKPISLATVHEQNPGKASTLPGFPRLLPGSPLLRSNIV